MRKQREIKRTSGEPGAMRTRRTGKYGIGGNGKGAVSGSRSPNLSHT